MKVCFSVSGRHRIGIAYRYATLPSESGGRAAAASTGVEIKEFAGGRYAALHHDGTGETIPRTWKRLVAALAESSFEHAHHQWLEEHFVDFGAASEVLSLDCLAPIR